MMEILPLNISLKISAYADSEITIGEANMNSAMAVPLRFFLVRVAARSVSAVFSGTKKMMNLMVLSAAFLKPESEKSFA